MKLIIAAVLMLTVSSCSDGISNEIVQNHESGEFKVVCMYGFQYIKGHHMLAPKFTLGEEGFVQVEECH